MKKLLLLFTLVLLPMMANAFTGEVVINGVKYFVKTGAQVAEVRGYTSECPSNLVIPATVECEGVICNVILIAESAFYGCTSLTSVTIPNSVTSIGGYAFYYCSNLTSITIGNSVTSIDGNAFQYCTSLTSVTIPNSVTSIGESAFSSCTSLTSVSIGNSVTSIGSSAFQGCTNLTSITIPNSVTSIGEGAFQGCSSLTSITIPNSVTSIGRYAFQNCSSLTSVTIPNSVTSIGYYAFRNCTSLTSITIPNSLTGIDWGAFSDCTSLTSITIPNSITGINYGVFRGCTSLTSITIPNSVTSIYEYAFSNCPDLTHVYCHSVNVPSTNPIAFEGSYPQYATLHVPDESVDAYRNISPWSQFGTIVGLSGGGGNNKCEKPIISYQSGKLVFSSATSGATCQYSITDSDITSGSGNEVQLTVTYNVSVYATKSGMENSDVAYATLCWIDKEPTINTNISNAVEFSATPILIQSDGGQLTIQGADDGTPISIFTSAGIQAGSTISRAGLATLSTNLTPGSIAIIKIGNRSVKVVMK